jgi:hypothetical protein
VSIEAFDKLVAAVTGLSGGNSIAPICGYIDPNTMRHAFSFLGPFIAVFAALLSLGASVLILFRDGLVGRFAGWSRFRLVVAAIVVICLLIGVAVVVLRLVQG